MPKAAIAAIPYVQGRITMGGVPNTEIVSGDILPAETIWRDTETDEEHTWRFIPQVNGGTPIVQWFRTEQEPLLNVFSAPRTDDLLVTG